MSNKRLLTGKEKQKALEPFPCLDNSILDECLASELDTLLEAQDAKTLSTLQADEGMKEKITEVIEQILCPNWYPSEVRKDASYRVADQLLALFEAAKLKAVEEAKKNPAPVVCLCGSTRFVETFNEWRKKLTLEGKIVVSIEIVTTQIRESDPQYSDIKTKKMLDELHLRKIDLADEVMILNVGGYIGESTRNELNYAESIGKHITFLESRHLKSQE